MDVHRFFVEGLQAGRNELAPDQAHHALHVLRVAAGTEVEVFDGQGRWGRGALVLERKRAWVEVGAVKQEGPPVVRLTLATAAPKGERAEWLLEQASQLSVTVLQWLDCERGVVKAKESAGKAEKWRRAAIESAKQCGRNWLLAVEPMRSLAAVLGQAAERGGRVLWLDPRAEAGLVETVRGWPRPWGGVTALVGPEGGWSEDEAARLAAAPGVVRVRLTPTVLRIETAGAAVAAVIACAGS